MDQRSVRVVVGQGDLTTEGLLRAVLEGAGFPVIGEAATIGELARVLRADPPDVVVLDDTIGVAAVQVANDVVPEAQLVVVWPAAVLPIGGAMRMDPIDLATALELALRRRRSAPAPTPRHAHALSSSHR